MFDLNLIVWYLKGRYHAKQFCEKMANSTYLSHWHSKTEWDIATSMCALAAYMMPLSFKNFVNFRRVTPELTELICERLVRHGQKLAYLVEYLRI